jgi:hypothetical protein
MRRLITEPHPEQRHANNLKPGVAPRELPCRPILKTSLHFLGWSVASSKTCTPSCRGSTPRCAGWPSLAHARLAARLAACHLIAHKEKRRPADVCRQHFADDRDLVNLIELKGAVTPAQTTVATWAAELAAVVVVDIVTNLLPASALAQLRAASGQDYAFIDGAVARVPVHTPTPSGGFVAEGGAIPVGALIIAALGLKPKKAGSITAITKELAAGSPLNVERSLRTLLALDLGLAIDAVLLSTPWPHQPRQPAYRTASRR